MKHSFWVVFIFLFTYCQKKEQNFFPPLPIDFQIEQNKRIQYLEQEELNNPLNDEIKYVLAKYLLKKNEVDKATLKIKEAINLTKPSKKHYLVLSECLYKKGDYDNALLTLQKININELPDDEFATYTIEIYKKAKKWAEVEKITDRMLKKNPKNKLVLNLKTDYLLFQKDTLAAIENIIKILKTDSVNIEIQYKLFDLYVAKQNIEAALALLKKINAQNTIEIKALKNIVKLYAKIKSMDSLKIYCQKLLIRDSTDSEINEIWADYNFNFKKYDIALKYFQKLDTHFVKQKDYFWFKSGVCLVYMGKAQQSISNFKNVKQSSIYFKKSKYYIEKYKIK